MDVNEMDLVNETLMDIERYEIKRIWKIIIIIYMAHCIYILISLYTNINSV